MPSDTPNDLTAADPINADQSEAIKEPRLWQDNGWTARVVKNEDDDGWAVEMIRDGEPEPALVGPWTMGRDKKNPKPLDTSAFNTLVKTASEVIRRHEQQLHAILHKELVLSHGDDSWRITLDIVPDEDEPHAFLAALDEFGEVQHKVRVDAGFKLSQSTALAWIEGGFSQPRR